mmetsp:Transcript_21309/g.70638  ORF Transcript_21309/g.70638 Transcript_21309/m.70638 type:complete len:278 (-) Transcript_21309:741-1574(-)
MDDLALLLSDPPLFLPLLLPLLCLPVLEPSGSFMDRRGHAPTLPSLALLLLLSPVQLWVSLAALGRLSRRSCCSPPVHSPGVYGSSPCVLDDREVEVPGKRREGGSRSRRGRPQGDFQPCCPRYARLVMANWSFRRVCSCCLISQGESERMDASVDRPMAEEGEASRVRRHGSSLRLSSEALRRPLLFLRPLPPPPRPPHPRPVGILGGVLSREAEPVEGGGCELQGTRRCWSHGEHAKGVLSSPLLPLLAYAPPTPPAPLLPVDPLCLLSPWKLLP